MSTPSDELTPINVVPHFSRLHEWIALEEGYFQDEGLEPHMFTEVMHSVSSHHGDEYGKRPQDLPFVEGQEVANSACEWGTACIGDERNLALPFALPYRHSIRRT